jgi:hypothetical protein
VFSGSRWQASKKEEPYLPFRIILAIRACGVGAPLALTG